MPAYSTKKKVLPAILPKPSVSSAKRKNLANASKPSSSNKKARLQSINSKKILAVTSDPNTYKIPEHFLSPDQPKPRILKSCTRCRKHKTKCNYVQTAPKSCQSCSKKDLTCQFEIVIPTKRSNMIKSLNDSIADLRRMVDNLVSQEKILKTICDSKGITVEGLVDIEKIDYSSMFASDEDHLDEYEEEDYDDDEDEDEDEDEEDDDYDYTTTTSGSAAAAKSNSSITPITSPNTTPANTGYKHGLEDLLLLNNDNTPVMTSYDAEILTSDKLSMISSPGKNNARPIKVT